MPILGKKIGQGLFSCVEAMAQHS